MSFPRYPSYKDDGVAWLGEVPGHWASIRYKNIFDEKAREGLNNWKIWYRLSVYNRARDFRFERLA